MADGSAPLSPSRPSTTPYGVHLIVASHTSEKAYHFDLIGRELTRAYGLPFLATAFKKLQIHDAPKEDGVGSKANGLIKFKKVLPIIRLLKDESSSAHQAMLQECESRGFRHDPKHTIVASEDSICGVEERVFPPFVKKLSKVVNPELLKNTHRQTVNGTTYVLFTHYGQIKDAAGTYQFHELLRQAGHKSGLRDDERVKMVDQVSLYYMVLSDSFAAPLRESINATKETQLFTPKGLHQRLDAPKDALLLTKDFQSTAETQHRPIGSYYFDHLLADSFRHAIAEGLMPQVLYKRAPNVKAFTRAGSKVTEQRLRAPVFAQVTPGMKLLRQKGTTTEQYIPKTLNECIDLLAMEFPAQKGDKGPRTADLVIVPPHAPQNDIERWMMTAMLASYGVARQTDPRYAHSSALYMNHQGVHDKYLGMLDTLSNLGMNGNYPRQPKLELYHQPDLPKIEERVTLRADYYAHVLTDDNIKNICSAAHHTMRHLMRGMSRSLYQPEEDSHGAHNQKLPQDAVVIAPLLSAANESRSILGQMHSLAKYAAHNGNPIIYGSMDKGGGKVLSETYRKFGGRHLEGVSTGLLAMTETEEGRINDKLLHAWYLYRTIAPRAAHITSRSDVRVSCPGGQGTLQEDALSLLLPVLEPQKYGHHIHIFADGSLKGVTQDHAKKSSVAARMDYLLTTPVANMLYRSHDALAAKGIYFSTSEKETEAIIRDNADSIMKAKRPPNAPWSAPAIALRA